MIVPRYWSEATQRTRHAGRSFTLKRFGWSDVSEQAAQAHARERVQAALSTLQAEGDVRRVDHKIAYNGAEGLPIREEVVEQHGDVVISRNSYGALCLNTPDVLFADVDFDSRPGRGLSLMVFAAVLGVSLLLAMLTGMGWLLALGTVVALLGGGLVARRLRALWVRLRGGVEALALARIAAVVQRHPELNLRIYRTPLGLRVLAMNATYAPASDKAQALLAELGSDPVYARMCRNQQCFRARVSPKPWRIGIERMTVTGSWPVKPERLAARRAWVAAYERQALAYAACRFVTEMGSRQVTPRAEQVRRLHDGLCRVHDSRLELA